jgi:hypothetical protein
MGEDDLDKTTPLYFEMFICTEFLHGSHSEFLRLSREDRKKLMMFTRVQAKKREREMKPLEEKQVETRVLSKAPRTRG